MGKKYFKKKYNIVYEPKACVWHHHGLNHSNDKNRSAGVGRILENFVIEKSNSTASVYKTHNLLTLISHNPSQKNKLFYEDLKKLKKLIGKKRIFRQFNSSDT